MLFRSGTIAERGYHTIDFVKEDKDEVFMTKGKRYAVVVKLEESGDTSYQTYECTHNDSALTEAVSANKGESYVQYSDGEWEDFSELEWSSKEKNNANLCIKMFSDTWDSTKATPTPTMTATPTATPTAAPTVTPMPTVLTNNKIECEIKDNKLIVSLNFEEDDELMYVAFRKGNELKKIVTPDIHNMTAEVDLSDTEYDSIDVYVWNGNMKPYAEVKQIEK